MRYGTIVKYFDDKNFGFIRSDSGQDCFFHISVVEAVEEGETPIEIRAGQPVKFELAPRGEANPSGRPARDDAKREQRRAKQVVLIDKLPGATGEVEEAPDRHPRARRKKPTWRR